jgi:DNA-nicking Smr family endonuclease
VTHRKLSPEEERAWALVARSIKMINPTAPTEKLSSGTSVPKNGPAIPAHSPSTATMPTTSTTQSSARPADRARERRVRRGQLEFSAKLDLHGHTQATADRFLHAFLVRQRAEHARCVLVITGKGRSGEGVIRRNFLNWLSTSDARQLVSGYAQSHQKHGGSGAFYVFLRRLNKPN